VPCTRPLLTTPSPPLPAPLTYPAPTAPTPAGFLGSGHVTYQQAMAAVFVEGWIFILISLSGMRGKIIQLIPKSIMLATGGGIGLFLAFIGLQQAEGIALVTGDSATLVTLGE
jgi:AGZA family xanthine/uracil permease-like MFS transporter